jgi:hypothetical protein
MGARRSSTSSPSARACVCSRTACRSGRARGSCCASCARRHPHGAGHHVVAPDGGDIVSLIGSTRST